MRGLPLLCIVGFALYGLLHVTDTALRESETEKASQSAELNQRNDRILRAWGRNLPALVIQQSPELPRQFLAESSGTDKQFVVSEKSTEAKVNNAEQEPIEWAEVILAARAHSEASVSSSTIRFYSPGAELQVVRRQDGWIEVIDPATKERGWVFERYLFSIEGPSRTQTEMDSQIGNEISTPKLTRRALPSSKQRSRSAKTAAQASDKFITKSELRRGRWARWDDHRRLFGPFGRRFVTFDAW